MLNRSHLIEVYQNLRSKCCAVCSGIAIDRFFHQIAVLLFVAPILFFFMGWLRPILALVASGFVLWGAIDYLRSGYTPIYIRPSVKSAGTAFIVLLVVATWVWFSGIGRLAFQNWDHEFRNAILHDLVHNPWPVRYYYTSPTSDASLDGQEGALVYYIAYWLPSALVGKVLGLHAAHLVLYGWTVTQVCTVVYFAWRWLQGGAILFAILLAVWSGFDVLGEYVVQGGRMSDWGAHIEWWATGIQYSAPTTTLYWTFNQAVPAWLAIFLILSVEKTRHLAFTAALVLPFAPLPFLGFVPFVAYLAVFPNNWDKNVGSIRACVVERLKGHFNLPNLLGTLAIVLVFVSYFGSNPENTGTHGFIWKLLDAENAGHFYERVTLFLLIEMGAYALVLQTRYRHEPMFVIAVISLIAIPFYSMGRTNDFVMRASIPGLIVLVVYTARYLREARYLGRFVLAGLVLLGSLNSFHEVYRSVKRTNEARKSSEYLAGAFKTFEKMSGEKTGWTGNFVALNPDARPFFRFLAK